MTERRVVLVCGPPCAGKTTYVRERMQPGDLVVDYDDIARRLGSPRTHGHDYKYHRGVERIIRLALNDIASGKRDRAWVVRSLPREDERAALAQRLRAEVVLLDEPDAVLAERAQSRRNPGQTLAVIRGWREQANASASNSHMS